MAIEATDAVVTADDVPVRLPRDVPSALARSYKPRLISENDRLDPVTDTELANEAVHVSLDRRLAQE